MNIKLKLIILFLALASALFACGAPAVVSPGPTAAITPTNDPRASAKVVKAFWDALGKGHLETAMTYVGDDIICRGSCHFAGKGLFQAYLQGYLKAGYVTKVNDLKNIGSTVTYSWEVDRDGVPVQRGQDDEVMEVQDGKIIYYECYHR